ncbi:MAG: hypothetical protein ACLPPF_16520 [Rhodomicrobium sp.]
MAVLIEAISVVIRADILLERFPGGWEAFRSLAPNQTLCADGELTRIGFMRPSDVEEFVSSLSKHDIIYQEQGKARDLVVVDQMRGPLAPCDWVEFGHLNLGSDPTKRVAACRKIGSPSQQIVTPDGWTFNASLSSYGFVPSEQLYKSLKFLRREGELDVYLNELTGKEVFVGRTRPSK